jgi:signal transduction histidine kinase
VGCRPPPAIGLEPARECGPARGGDGPVDLSVRAAGSDVLLTVRNEGPPIPADALPNIFDPLVRGSSPELQKQRRPGSIGLGLYIAREVVLAHGGTIDVTSSAEGGTVFRVRLPRRYARR